jgi:hypothetical protein
VTKLRRKSMAGLGVLLFSIYVTAATPTLVQYHSQGGTSGNYSVGGGYEYNVRLPNPVTAGNSLVLECYSKSGTGTVTVSSTSNGVAANTWVAGPSTTASSSGMKLSLWYALNATPGFTVISASPATTTVGWQCAAFEFNNIIAADGNSGTVTNNGGTGSIMSAPAYTPGNSNDFLINSCFVDGVWTGSSNPTSFGVGNNAAENVPLWQFAATSLGWDIATEFGIQTTATSIQPQMVQGGNGHYICASQAFRTGAAGGALAGMHIVGITSEDTQNFFCNGGCATVSLEMPVFGNLVAVTYEGVTTQQINSITSSPSPVGGWKSRALVANAQNAQILAGENLVASNNMTLKIVQSQDTSSNTINLIDIAGAASAPYDTSVATQQDVTGAADVTTPSITPTVPGGLVVAKLTISGNTATGLTNPGPEIFTSCTFGGTGVGNNSGSLGTDNPCDRNNGNANVRYTSLSPIAFTWHFGDMPPQPRDTTSVVGWGFAAVAFSPGTSSPSLSPPSGLAATVN